MHGESQPRVYRTSMPVIDAHYSETDLEVVDVLAAAISEAAGVSPDNMPPLYHTIDLDPVTRLLDRHDGAANGTLLLTFEYEQWEIFVRADGRIRICDRTRCTDPEPVFEGEAAIPDLRSEWSST